MKAIKKSLFKKKQISNYQILNPKKWRVILRNFVKKNKQTIDCKLDKLPLCNMNRGQKKSIQAISYLANKSERRTINKLKLVKLLWIADKYHLIKYGRPILKDRYCAMKFGPVQTEMLDLLKKENIDYINENLIKHQYSLTAIKEPETLLFSESDLEVLDLVWERFGLIDNFALAELSHYYPEWRKFEDDIKNPNKPSSYDMNWEDFFNLPNPTEDNMADFFLSISQDEMSESFETLKLRRKFESA